MYFSWLILNILASKKQSIVSWSSIEVEYRALTSTTREIQWLTYILKELQLPFISPSLLSCDNKSTTYIATNPTFHERSKHIDIDYHVVSEKLQTKLFHLLPISTKDQLAYIFTKPLDFKPFYKKIVLVMFFCFMLG